MGVRRALLAARRRWRALAAAALCACALALHVPAHLAASEHFPAHAPAQLAHQIAVFSNQPDITSWWVEEDHSNYTMWRYSVSYTCGARCSGRADVRALADPPTGAAPRHGPAARHRVELLLRSCTATPLLSWPRFCEELDIRAAVSEAAGGGAQLHEDWRTRCSALAWLSGACARRMRARRDLLVTRLRASQPAA